MSSANSSRSSVDYSGVTEVPGNSVTRDAASMAVSRYELVRRLSVGKRVLEIGCGAGQGLRYVGEQAALIIGGDITASLLAIANEHHRGELPLVRLDGHQLPFADGSFDIVQMHEAIYYMANAGNVIRECRRVLSTPGVLVVSTINPEWADFNPSPHATRYLNASELELAVAREFRSVDILFGFPASNPSVRSAVVSQLKRLAVKLHVIPGTMKGKAAFKRIFLGPLQAVPPELTAGFAAVDEPRPAPREQAERFKVIYAVAAT
jgi:ubiquinone/menaquinone biosynthesis C-methylase UbiE